MIKIIKALASANGPSPARTETSDFVDLSQELEAQLDHARREAGAIIAAAQDEADEIRRQAAAQGRHEAVRSVQAELQQTLESRLSTALAAWEDAVSALRQVRNQQLQECEQYLVRLALAVAEKVIRAELANQPDIPLRLVREALEMCAGSQRIKLHLNPVDYDTLRSAVDGMVASQDETTRVDVVTDPQVTRGGCQVRTEFGCIDQQFTTQLARIREELA